MEHQHERNKPGHATSMHNANANPEAHLTSPTLKLYVACLSRPHAGFGSQSYASCRLHGHIILWAEIANVKHGFIGAALA